MRRHFEKLIALKGEYVGVREMRQHAAWYTKGIRGGAEFRKNFNCAESVDAVLKIIDSLRSVDDENFADE